MTFLLDTNTCIKYLNNSNAGVMQRMKLTNPEEIRLCDIVKAELYFGAYNSSRTASNLQVIEEFFSQFGSLRFDSAAAEVYGRIRAELKAAGKLIGPLDLQIAAIALANDLTLITHNTGEFSRVTGLRIEDWES